MAAAGPAGAGGRRPQPGRAQEERSSRTLGPAGPHVPDYRSVERPRDDDLAVAPLDAPRPGHEIPQVDGLLSRSSRDELPAEGNRLDGGVHVARFEHGLSDAPHLAEGVLDVGPVAASRP